MEMPEKVRKLELGFPVALFDICHNLQADETENLLCMATQADIPAFLKITKSTDKIIMSFEDMSTGQLVQVFEDFWRCDITSIQPLETEASLVSNQDVNCALGLHHSVTSPEHSQYSNPQELDTTQCPGPVSTRQSSRRKTQKVNNAVEHRLDADLNVSTDNGVVIEGDVTNQFIDTQSDSPRKEDAETPFAPEGAVGGVSNMIENSPRLIGTEPFISASLGGMPDSRKAAQVHNPPITKSTFAAPPKAKGRNVCLLCGKVYQKCLESLRKHISIQHGVDWNQYRQLFTSTFRKSKKTLEAMRLEVQSEKGFLECASVNPPCPLCGKTYSFLNCAVKHLRTKHRQEPDVERMVKALQEEWGVRATTGKSMPSRHLDHGITQVKVEEPLLFTVAETEGSDIGSALAEESHEEKMLPEVLDIKTDDCPNVFQCEVCESMFLDDISLKMHHEQVHEFHQNIRQNIDDKDDGTAGPRVVHVTNKPSKVKCTSKREAKTAVSKKQVRCPLCQQRYTGFVNIAKHITIKHNKHPRQQETINELDRRVNQVHYKYDPLIPCPYCSCEKRGRESIFSHIRFCHPRERDLEKTIAGMDPQIKELYYLEKLKYQKCKYQKDKDKHSNGNLAKCMYCAKEFTFSSTRSRHEKHYCTENPKKVRRLCCKFCSYTTVNKEELERHTQSHCLDEPSFLCHVCGLSTRSKSGMLKHKREAHNICPRAPVKVSSCEVCAKVFRGLEKLKKHMLTHGERTFTCDICTKSFYRGDKLRAHREAIHEGKYPYHCDKCGHGIRDRIYLKKHQCGRVKRLPRSAAAAVIDPQVQPSMLPAVEAFDTECIQALVSTEGSCSSNGLPGNVTYVTQLIVDPDAPVSGGMSEVVHEHIQVVDAGGEDYPEPCHSSEDVQLYQLQPLEVPGDAIYLVLPNGNFNSDM